MGRLCLSRKTGETFWIGPKVSVTLVKAERGKAKLRIDAPDYVKVLRAELLIGIVGGGEVPITEAPKLD
jgi:carbon storage regulator CsrA